MCASYTNKTNIITMNISLLIRHCNYIKLWALEVSPSATIEEIKKKIEKNWHVPADKQCLSIKLFRDLPDDKQICEYNDNDNKISMHLTLKKD